MLAVLIILGTEPTARGKTPPLPAWCWGLARSGLLLYLTGAVIDAITWRDRQAYIAANVRPPLPPAPPPPPAIPEPPAPPPLPEIQIPRRPYGRPSNRPPTP